MGGATELGGPDLTEGVALASVPEGGMLLGHAHGEPVLLARTGGRVYALSATCTHYGGPLAEGLLQGHTVRCPWHHACFDVRTGEALRAPALNDATAWQVESSAGNVRVTARKAPAQHSHTGGPASVLIVGAGAAGESAAEALRREGYTGPVTLVDADSDLPYDKPNLSKDYLAGKAPEEWIPLKSAEFFKEKNIELKLGRRVTAIDAGARRVSLDDGTTLEYDRLLLATGSQPIRLPPDVARGQVFYLRTFADSKRIIAAAQKGKRAVVIGASFIGLEVAASLRMRGLAVHVVAPETIPLERVLGEQLGRFVRDLHEENGVVFQLGHTSKLIEDGRVTLDDGSVLEADLVVAGIGVRPVTDLAESMGARTERGILVNEFLETSVPDVFAAGDLARWTYALTGEPIRVEHWVMAQRQGKAAALNLLGRREAYLDVPFFWSAHYDVTIAYVGHASSWDHIEVEGRIEERDATVRYLRAGQLLAAATIFRDHDSLQIEAELEKRIQEVSGR